MENLNKCALTLAAFSVYGMTQSVDAKTKQLPNFIIINCDDMGYGDLGCYGHPTIKTPNLDNMAHEGQKWSSFYVCASVSSPSRSGLMTGRLPVRTGMYGNKRNVLFPNSPKGLPGSELTIASLLKRKEYTTACVGKWHMGHQPESMPLKHGFDYYYGIPYSNDMSVKAQNSMGRNYKYELPYYDQEEVIEIEPEQTLLTKRLTEYAVSFIKSNKDKPFFLYLAHPMPHNPVSSSKEFQGVSANGRYGDAIQELDWSVGQVLEALLKQGLDDNTIVVFTSDNGPWLNKNGGGGSAGMLRDGKGSVSEGGFRVPCIFWGKKYVKAQQQIVDMGSTLDLLPTFCDLAGIALPEDRIYDGFSLKNTLSGKAKSPRTEFPFYQGGKLFAYRKGNFKVHLQEKPSKTGVPSRLPLLYNLGIDPGEKYALNKSFDKEKEDVVNAAKAFENTIKDIPESIYDLPAYR